jgi:hypothetical protein
MRAGTAAPAARAERSRLRGGAFGKHSWAADHLGSTSAPAGGTYASAAHRFNFRTDLARSESLDFARLRSISLKSDSRSLRNRLKI